MTHSIASPGPGTSPLAPEHLAAVLPCCQALAQVAQALLDFHARPVTPAATN
jgi:hypothetical protein